MKEEILSLLSMQDVLNKYGFNVRHGMFHCPLHGKDKNASAKAYDKSFYCFACNRHGDLIEFVKQYFNLDFQQAMEKINFDFSLGLNSFKKMSKKELIEIQRKCELERKLKEKKKQKYNGIMIKACNRLQIYNRQIKYFEERLKDFNNPNWVDDMFALVFLEEQVLKLDTYIDNKIDELKS